MGLKAFQKGLAKRNIDTGVYPLTEWLSFDNLAMNWVCTGSFRKCLAHRRNYIVAGMSGAGKTMSTLQLATQAQSKGYHVVYLDSEGAVDIKDLEMNKVDTSEDKLTFIGVTTHEDVIDIFTEALNSFPEDSKLFFVVDSLTALMTSNEDENFDKGKTTNDMGRKVQANKKLLSMITSRIRTRDWFFISTAHVYENQDILNGRGRYIMSQVGSAEYYPSLILQLTKLDLRDGQEQTGIRVNVTTRKNRFFKLGQRVQLPLVYPEGNIDGGFEKYDGVLDILKDYGYINQAGAWYNYDIIDTETGEVLENKKFQSKNFAEHAEYLIDRYEADRGGEIVEQDEIEAQLDVENAKQEEK